METTEPKFVIVKVHGCSENSTCVTNGHHVPEIEPTEHKILAAVFVMHTILTNCMNSNNKVHVSIMDHFSYK